LGERSMIILLGHSDASTIHEHLFCVKWEASETSYSSNCKMDINML